MNKETSEALESGIVKYKRDKKYAQSGEYGKILLGKGSCGLCDLFHNDECKGCPVLKKTTVIFCLHTPYYRVYRLLRLCKGGCNCKTEIVQAIGEMIEFLEKCRDA